MLQQLLARLGTSVALLGVISLGVFLLTTLSPRHPEVYRLGPDAPASAVEDLRQELGLDLPLPVQFGNWFADAVQGDLGSSYLNGRPVVENLAVRIPRTLSLICAAAFLTAIIGFALGITAALYQGGVVDRVLSGVAALMQAVPGFWLGILLVTLFALTLNLLPATGYVPLSRSFTGWLASIALPAISLAFPSAAAVGRQLRTALNLEVGKDYVRCAVATGASRTQVVIQSALRNAMGPAVTILGYQIMVQLSTSVVIEKIFAIDGLGTMALNALFTGDTPSLLAAVLTFSVIVLAVNFIVDLAYGWLYPKAKAS